MNVRRHRSVPFQVLRALLLLALIGIAFWLLAGTFAMTVLGYRDPWDTSFPVSLRNDTQRPLLFSECDDACDGDTGFTRLGPGRALSTREVPYSGDHWLVETVGHHRLGCFTVNVPASEAGSTIDVGGEFRKCPPAQSQNPF